MWAKKILSVLLIVGLITNSFSQSQTNSVEKIQQQVLEIKNFPLTEQKHVIEFSNFLSSLLLEIKAENKNGFHLDDQKDYYLNLKKLSKITHYSEIQLSKVQLTREVFVKKYLKEDNTNLWEKVSNFITSPFGIVLSIGIATGVIWIFRNKIIEFFYPSTHSTISLPQEKDVSSNSLLEINDDSTIFSKEIIEEQLRQKQINHLLHKEDDNKNNAFIWASSHGHYKIIEKMMVLKGVNDIINHQNNLGQTALMVAAMKGHKKIAREILKKLTFSEIITTDRNNRTAQHLAFINKKIDTFFLINQYMPKFKEHYCCSIEMIKKAIKEKNLFNLLNIKCCSRDTPLIHVASHNKIRILKKLLESIYVNSIRLNQQDENGWTALMASIAHKNIESTEIILNSDKLNAFGMNKMNKQGLTALHMAIRRDNSKAVKVLVENNKMTRKIIRYRDSKRGEHWTPLLRATIYGQLRIMRYLVFSNKFTIKDLDDELQLAYNYANDLRYNQLRNMINSYKQQLKNEEELL